MKIYVASSWRCALQPAVVAMIRNYLGHDHQVYDFRNPAPGNSGFSWKSIDGGWESWTPEQYRENLKHPIAVAGHKADMDALRDCDLCILVLPSGRSASWELGWAVGAGKVCAVVMFDKCEPELMYAGLDILINPNELFDWLDVESCRLHQMKHQETEAAKLAAQAHAAPPGEIVYWCEDCLYAGPLEDHNEPPPGAQLRERCEAAPFGVLCQGHDPMDKVKLGQVVATFTVGEKRPADLFTDEPEPENLRETPEVYKAFEARRKDQEAKRLQWIADHNLTIQKVADHFVAVSAIPVFRFDIHRMKLTPLGVMLGDKIATEHGFAKAMATAARLTRERKAASANH